MMHIYSLSLLNNKLFIFYKYPSSNIWKINKFTNIQKILKQLRIEHLYNFDNLNHSKKNYL